MQRNVENEGVDCTIVSWESLIWREVQQCLPKFNIVLQGINAIVTEFYFLTAVNVHVGLTMAIE